MARAVDLSVAGDGFEGWTPIRVHWREQPVVEWCWTDQVAFEELFFVDTVQRAFRLPFSLLFRRETPIDALANLDAGLAATGFVFHVSRCGSSLVARMLSCVPGNLVVAEPLPIDQILRADAPEADKVRWLRWMVSALGRRRTGAERAYILKLDAWSVCSLATIRRAFPLVPWVFLVRDPVQVLASHFRQRGAHMVPGALDPSLFGLDWRAITEMPQEEYCARVLASLCRSARENWDERAIVVDHSELPDAVFDRILETFGLECDAEELTSMRETAAFDAKAPTRFYVPDSAAKEQEATPELRDAADRWVRPLYEELVAC